MNQHIRKMLTAILFVFSICSFTLLLCGCAKTPTASSDSSVLSPSDLEELGVTGQPITPEFPVTSFDKIDAALAEKKLTETQAYALKIIANYNSDSLPSAFAGEASRDGFQGAKMWLQENWESLDQKTKEALEPYYVLPDDPKSFFNAKDDAVRKAVELISVIPSVEAASPTWETMTTTISSVPERKAKIFFKGTSIKAQAEWIGEAFNESFLSFDSLLDVSPDKTIYIYIIPMSSYGSAIKQNADGANRCIIEIKQGLDKTFTKSTLVHELFHCFQFELPLDYNPNDERWLMEATATWSEEYIYPEANSEHEYLKRFFTYLDKNMMYYGNNREYATYAWILFLTQSKGDESIVKTILVDAKTKGAKDAVIKLDNFNELFREYSVWNWNEAYAKNYEDIPNFPGSPYIVNSPAMILNVAKEKKITKETISMEKLGMKYYAFVNRADAKKIKFTFEKIGDSSHNVIALVKTAEGWRREDWSNLKEKVFCANREYEKIRLIILVFSNADATADYKLNMDVDTTSECTPSWHGTTTISWKSNDEFALGIAGSGVFRTLSTEGLIITQDELLYDEENGGMDVIKQTASYSFKSAQKTTYSADGDCGKILEEGERVSEGYGVFDYSTLKRNTHRKIDVNNGEDDDYYFIKKGGTARFDPGISGDYDWITSTYEQKTVYGACGVSGKLPVTDAQTIITKGRDWGEVSDFDVVFNEDKVLKGTYNSPVNREDLKPYNITIEYDYEYS